MPAGQRVGLPVGRGAPATSIRARSPCREHPLVEQPRGGRRAGLGPRSEGEARPTRDVPGDEQTRSGRAWRAGVSPVWQNSGHERVRCRSVDRSRERFVAMMAFDHVYLEVARRESRAITTTSRAGVVATLLFREFYCTEPGCDCRRVILHVHWVEENRIAASINYAFDRSRRRDEPQISLDPLNPQSEISDDVLAIFCDMIASDREYRGRSEEHTSELQ